MHSGIDPKILLAAMVNETNDDGSISDASLVEAMTQLSSEEMQALIDEHGQDMHSNVRASLLKIHAAARGEHALEPKEFLDGFLRGFLEDPEVAAKFDAFMIDMGHGNARSAREMLEFGIKHGAFMTGPVQGPLVKALVDQGMCISDDGSHACPATGGRAVEAFYQFLVDAGILDADALVVKPGADLSVDLPDDHPRLARPSVDGYLKSDTQITDADASMFSGPPQWVKVTRPTMIVDGEGTSIDNAHTVEKLDGELLFRLPVGGIPPLDAVMAKAPRGVAWIVSRPLKGGSVAFAFDEAEFEEPEGPPA